jgi:type II secretory pathway predicted ATPase ExeA
MQGLKKEETEDYLAKRLRAAGSLNTVFTSSAAEAIYSQSKGIPRLVNNLATSSLMYACSVRREQVDEEIVYQGQKDFDI